MLYTVPQLSQFQRKLLWCTPLAYTWKGMPLPSITRLVLPDVYSFFAAPGHLLTLRIGDVMLAHLEDAAHFPDFVLQRRVNFMDEEVRACGWCMCTRCTTHVSSGFKHVTA